MTHILRKAIFPVAGLGTRFLPATKANPKEMLPIIDKPLIQYAVEEAIAAGLTELIFVTNYSKHTIQEHFDPNHALESTLEQRGQLDLLKIVHDILPPGITCTYIHQPNALGLGHAILCAKEQIANEPFAVLLADDLISDGAQGCLHEMAAIFTETGSNVIALEKVSPSDTAKYGIVELKHTAENYHPISSIVEKPAPENAPSNLAVVGRYILHPSILKALEATHSDNHNEIQLTDAISGCCKA